MNTRQITKIYRSPEVINDGEIELYRALPTYKIESLGPFVFLDHYKSNSPRGIGDSAHPHAGIEVFSYLIEGGVHHKDSMGFEDTINAGDSQYIKSGSGILHKEVPTGARHGIQLWTNLPAKHKFDEPQYASYKSEVIPTINENGNTAKILSGKANDIQGAIKPTSQTVLIPIHLENNYPFTLKIDKDLQLGLYVMQGILNISEIEIKKGDLAILSNGDEITIQAIDFPADVVLLGGDPITEPLVFDGPFVMDSRENIKKAQHNFLSGKMGTLDGVPF